jgi:hypothetical protein
MICVLAALGWWLIASGLLLLSWNRVVTTFVTVKKVKYWQVLLVVLTLAVLFVPLCHGRQARRGMMCDKARSMECGQMGKQCGSCESWKMPADTSGHLGK